MSAASSRTRRSSLLAFGAAALLLAGLSAPGLQAQQFVNGDFETWDFSGWTIEPTSSNGQTFVQLVELIDIDGPGPLEPAPAARFSVGGITAPAEREGIELTQMLELTAGVEYTFSFNWATTHPNGSNSDGGAFTLIIDGNPIGDTIFAGSTSSTVSNYGFIERQFTPSVSGPHKVGVRITRQFRVTSVFGNSLSQWVDNFTVQSGTASCYADCDGNEVLNIDDFLCFINLFAQNDPYADCDGNGVFNIDDFLCFINEFAQGCP